MVKDYKNTNIKIFNIKNNGCIAKSRNLGVIKARGKFIAFLRESKRVTVCLIPFFKIHFLLAALN